MVDYVLIVVNIERADDREVMCRSHASMRVAYHPIITTVLCTICMQTANEYKVPTRAYRLSNINLNNFTCLKYIVQTSRACGKMQRI